MIYGEILNFFNFYHFDPDLRFPPYLLYVGWKSGVTFVRRCIRDVIRLLIVVYTILFRFSYLNSFRLVKTLVDLHV